MFLPEVRTFLSQTFNRPVLIRHSTGVGLLSFVVGFIAIGIAAGDVTANKEATAATPAPVSTEKPVPKGEPGELYQKAFDLQGQGKKKEAAAAYMDVLDADPNYKDARNRMASLNHAIRAQEKKEKRQKDLSDKYKKAFNLQGQNKKWDALTAYKAVEKIEPNYKDVKKRIASLTEHFAQKAREQKAAQERAAKKEREKWDLAIGAYRVVMSKFNFIESVSYNHNLPYGTKDRNPWITVTVKNNWHYEPEQIRKQAAQSMWELWARTALAQNLTEEVDSARIKIVDYRGNEVGGSRMIAGSMIWVD